jgi:hypothetical protein
MGVGRLVTLLSWVPALSRPIVKGELLGRRSKHHIKTGHHVLGAWCPSLDGDLDPLIGEERVDLVCAWGIDEACVSGYPAGLH